MVGTGSSAQPSLGDPFVQDPHAVYDELRRGGAARRVTMPNGIAAWVVPRYAEARELLTDPRLCKDNERLNDVFARTYGDEALRDDPGIDSHMLMSDPPDHTRLRKLVNKAFTSRRIELLRPRVQQIADASLDVLSSTPAGSTVDLIDTYAFPIPVTVICELLGVPLDDRDDFRAWTAAVLSTGDDAEGYAARAMAAYLTDLVSAKRAEPVDDMLSALVLASEEEDRLDQTELVSMAFLLLVAGHETTVNLIGNGVLALLRHPDQLAALRADRTLLPGTVEEFLRYDGPVNMATMRFTAEPVEVGDVTIPDAELVLISLGSANRDPDRFAAPHALDITRRAGGHLAFGHGIHHCLGAPLARMEGAIAIGDLLDRFPQLRLAAEPAELRWRNSTLIRGLTELPVVLRA